MRYTMILTDGRESGDGAICPALPGCVSQGRTKRGALNTREAVEVYLEPLLKDWLPVATERGRQTVEVEVAARWSTLPRGLSGRQGRRALARAGCQRAREKGTHMVRRRDAPLAQMVAPAPSSIDTGTLAASLGTAGIDAEPLRELL